MFAHYWHITFRIADALEPDRRRMTPKWDLLPGEGVWIRATVRIRPRVARSPCGRCTVSRCA